MQSIIFVHGRKSIWVVGLGVCCIGRRIKPTKSGKFNDIISIQNILSVGSSFDDYKGAGIKRIRIVHVSDDFHTSSGYNFSFS